MPQKGVVEPSKTQTSAQRLSRGPEYFASNEGKYVVNQGGRLSETGADLLRVRRNSGFSQ